jgi:hypothetical protein
MTMFDVIGRASVSVFGEDVTVERPGWPAQTFKAIFDSAFYEGLGGEFPAADLVTTISFRDHDAPDIPVESVVIARGARYKVRERRPDSEGMSVFELEMHKRQELRQAIVAAIGATPTFAGRTFSSRQRSTEVGEAPVALVYFLRETSQHLDIRMDLDRTARCVVEIKGVADCDQDVADVLDGYCETIEAAMYADPMLGGLALGLELVETSIDLDPSGDRRDATAMLGFDVRYYTERPVSG